MHCINQDNEKETHGMTLLIVDRVCVSETRGVGGKSENQIRKDFLLLVQTLSFLTWVMHEFLLLVKTHKSSRISSWREN